MSMPTHSSARLPVRGPRPITVLAMALSLLLAACSKDEPPPPLRPVRAAVLTPAAGGASTEFSGEVRPRIESRPGFRVAGKITARKVDVGAPVKKRGTC
ncbi:hypothetical protein [Massilia sp. Se16.2.3]|uniref:hypothetical protein n=1 Tax=Massilia sp. Se16.2.3 TaxID=2709303 RepID=UPI001E4067C8|nr:hypothetical protein [Massilia sp. Se16.2.3]